jgi:hypothetical protein
MALEQTSETRNDSKLLYDQITTSNRKDSGGKTVSQRETGDSNRSDRFLDSASDRQEINKSTTSRTTTEKVNIAFEISFNIPFVGVVPTTPC